MHDLFQRWEREKQGPRPGLRVCRGTFLSRAQYLVDIEEWGYADARRFPNGTMSAEEISTWTEAIPAELRHSSERAE